MLSRSLHTAAAGRLSGAAASYRPQFAGRELTLCVWQSLASIGARKGSDCSPMSNHVEKIRM